MRNLLIKRIIIVPHPSQIFVRRECRKMPRVVRICKRIGEHADVSMRIYASLEVLQSCMFLSFFNKSPRADRRKGIPLNRVVAGLVCDRPLLVALCAALPPTQTGKIVGQ